MKIGISGASGHLGQKVLSRLTQHGGGHHLVGVSRSPQTVSGRGEGRFGDYDKPDSLVEAYVGLDRLLIIPSAELAPGVRGRQLRAAIEAAKQAGVAHIFLMSAMGTHEEAVPSLGEAYWVGEQALIGTAPRWTILRMNFYAQSMADEIKMSLGGGVLAGLGDERVAYVSRDDVAAAAAGALLGEGHSGAIYNLTGPASITGAERASIVSEIVGKPIGYVAITVDQLRAGLAQAGLPELILDAMTEIKTSFIEGKFDIVTGDVTRLSGHPPKSLREILAVELA
ncbi:NAD(P)-dependent oxidoreductase [Trinickia symbiotica]|uniref:NAD(P)-dependent oxidoreductase n=1 Tax=Trinickia symbiotica TaxID=863227 RepID=A0A2T3XZ69_9BURK|nr:SDR family oxidoreductase [Trinickia symbiotica]PTB21817.1 NAD(P)-dependent oxidoreductase [Trinickia symbiotica]